IKSYNQIGNQSGSLSMQRQTQISRDVNGELGERNLPSGEQYRPRSEGTTESLPKRAGIPELANTTGFAEQNEDNQRSPSFAQPVDSLLTEGMENKGMLEGEIQAGAFPMEADPYMAYLEGKTNPDGIIIPFRKIYTLDQSSEQIPHYSTPLIAAPGTKNILDYCFSGKTEGDITGHYRKETSSPILKSSSPSIRNRKFWARQIRKNPQIKAQSPVKSKRHRIENENPELTDVERKAKLQKSHSAIGEGDVSHESINAFPTAEAVMQPCRAP
ncbi:hypothetical protein U1Q18_011892, partial [Sarracenia purpurea var. burkii]